MKTTKLTRRIYSNIKKEEAKRIASQTVYCVQETIGGCKQFPCFYGTWDECREYLSEWLHYNGSYAIISAKKVK